MFLRWIDRWIKLAPLMCLLVGAVCGNAMAADRAPESPVRVVKVTIAEGALQGFLEQLRRAADAHRFAFRADQSSPNPDNILVQMWRADIKGIGVNTSESEAADITYSIFLYRNCNDDIPEWWFDEVVSQLRKGLSETEGLISIEEEEEP